LLPYVVLRILQICKNNFFQNNSDEKVKMSKDNPLGSQFYGVEIKTMDNFI